MSASQSQPVAESPDAEPSGSVSWRRAPADVTLWGVYGAACFPTVFACQLNDHPESGRVIWGYSVYEGEPGFRTLGRCRDWADEHDLRLFLTRGDAFAHVATGFPDPPPGQEVREALETAAQALREVAHAQSQGSRWYTKGEAGLYSHVDHWVRRGLKATNDALRDLAG